MKKLWVGLTVMFSALLFSAAAFAVSPLSVSPASAPANTPTGFTIQTVATAPGSFVFVKVCLDANGNGVIDPNEWPINQGFVTDNVPVNMEGFSGLKGDLDPSSPGITVNFGFGGGFMPPGQYIVQVKNSAGSSATASFTITPASAPRTVTGTVYEYGTTNPVPGAVVFFNQYLDNAAIMLSAAVTDASGNYTLEVGGPVPVEGSIGVLKDGMISAPGDMLMVDSSGVSGRVLYMFAPTATITGTATEYGTGTPVKGVLLRATTMDGRGALDVLTDGAGHYSMPSLDGVEWAVNATSAAPPGYFSARFPSNNYSNSVIIMPTIAGPNTLDLIVSRETASINVTLMDEYGSLPVEGALAYANYAGPSNDPAAKSQANGHYTNTAGTVTIKVDSGTWGVGLCLNCHEHPVKVGGVEKEMVPSPVFGVDLTDGQSAPANLTAYYADGAIEGTVYQQDGITPAPSGVSVSAWSENATNGASHDPVVGRIETRADTDETGHFRLPLLSGTWHLRSELYEWNKQSAWQDISVVTDGNDCIDQPGETVTGLSFTLNVDINHCSNGIQDADETAVDCGGTDCIPCQTNHCTNGIQDADETGVDCGGADCVPCAAPETWALSGLNGKTVNTVAVSPAYSSDHTTFAGTNEGVFKTTDGGATWAPVNNGITYSHIKALAVSPNYAIDYTVFADTEYGFYRTNDGGESWTDVSNGMTDIYSVAVSPNFASDHTVFAGTSQDGMFKSTDGGDNWSQVNASLIPSVNLYDTVVSPDYANDNTVFAGIWSSGVLKSTDGGYNWSPVNSGLNTGSFEGLAISPNYAADHTLMAATSIGPYLTTNGGDNWYPMNNGLPQYESGGSWVVDPNCDPCMNDPMFCEGYCPTIWMPNYAPPEAVKVALSPNYASDHTAFVSTRHITVIQQTGMSYEYDAVYRTTDGGSNWTDFSSGLGYQALSLAVSPSYTADHTVFAGTDVRLEGFVMVGGGVYKYPGSATPPNHCTNGIQDYDETGVDCGGADCAACDTTPPDVSIYDPAPGTVVTGSYYYVYGESYDDGSGVQTVEASPDGGKTWYTAYDTYEDGSWEDWEFDWALPSFGSPTLLVRATDYAGHTSQTQLTVTIAGATLDSLTPSTPSPALVNNTVTWTGIASGGSGSYEFKFMLRDPSGVWTTPQGYSSNNTYSWTPATAGKYQVSCYVRNAGSFSKYDSFLVSSFYHVNYPASQMVSLTPSIPSPALVNNLVTWTGAATGGSGSYEYKFMLRDPAGVWTTVKDYGVPGNTYDWTPTATGKYQALCYVRNSGTLVKSDSSLVSAYYYVNYPTAQMVSLAPSAPSPALVNNLVTWTGIATGGSGSYEYKFMLRDPAGVWTTVKDYGVAGNTWGWTPTASGKYQVICYVRNGGSTAKYDAYLTSNFYYVNFPASQMVSLTPSVPGPVGISVPVTWTGIATGGSGSYEFKFMLRDPAGVWTTVKDYGVPGNSWLWYPAAPGKYQVLCYVRNAGTLVKSDGLIVSGWFYVQ